MLGILQESAEVWKVLFEESELEENLVVRKFRTTAADGKAYEVDYYNLDLRVARSQLEAAGEFPIQKEGLAEPDDQTE
jgi:hypothetical protein